MYDKIMSPEEFEGFVERMGKIADARGTPVVHLTAPGYSVVFQGPSDTSMADAVKQVVPAILRMNGGHVRPVD